MMEFEERSLVSRLRKLRLTAALPLVSGITLILGLADLFTGNELSFSIFYLLPVTLAVLIHGRRLGLAFSFICAIVWVVADLQAGARYSSLFFPIWNTLVRLAYFLFYTLLISSLLESARKLRELTLKDPLTEAANWRYFEEYSSRMIRTAVREGQKLTVAYLDVDNFKSINDSLGHGIGDEVLQTLCGAIQGEIRPMDMLARLGGDEFAIILANTDLAISREILARIIARVTHAMRLRGWPVTLSIGAIVFAVIPSTVGPMLKQVDDLMYEVKKGGKNSLRLMEQAEQLSD